MMSSSQIKFSDYDTVILAGISGLELSEFNTPRSKLVIYDPDPERQEQLETLYAGNSVARVHKRGLSGAPSRAVYHRYNLSRMNGIGGPAAAREFFPNLREVGSFEIEQKELNAAIAEANLKRGERNLLVIGANAGASDLLAALAQSSAARRLSQIQVFAAEEALFDGDGVESDLLQWAAKSGFELISNEALGRDPYHTISLKRASSSAKPAPETETAPAPAPETGTNPDKADTPEPAPVEVQPSAPAYEVELRRALLGLDEKAAELELAKATSKLNAEQQRLSVEQLTQELEQAQALNTALKTEKNQAKRLAGAAKSRANTAKTKHQKAIIALNSETAARERLERELNKLQSAHNALREQAEGATSARDTLAQELERAQQDVEQLRAQLEEQQGAIEDLKRSGETLQTERDALAADCEALTQQERSSASRQAELEQAAEAAETSRREQAETLQALQKELTETQEQVERLTTQLTRKEQEFAVERTTLNRKADDEQANATTLKQELETARDNLSLAVRMQTMLEANQKDLQQKYTALSEEKREADALIAAFMHRLQDRSAAHAEANLPGSDESFAEFTEVTDDNNTIKSS